MSADGQQIDLSKLSREELERRYMLLQTEYNTVEAKINWYFEQYRLSMQKRYGKSSESDISGQLSLSDLPLFNEAEAFRDPLNIELDLEKVISKQSQKKSKHRGNKKDLKNIPVETTVYTLSGKDLLCPNCGNDLKEMKEEVQTVLEVIPAQVKVHKHVIKHYSCRACAKNKKSSIVKASGAPLKIIPKSIASPSPMADIIRKKYVDATPFYRQEQNFKRRSIC